MQGIADIAKQGKTAIVNKDYKALAALMNQNFDFRRKIMNLRDEDVNLVQTARSCGASAKFTGSGGSIIGIYEDDTMLNHLKVELQKVKARVIKPFIL
jgi:glucuronokinase